MVLMDTLLLLIGMEKCTAGEKVSLSFSLTLSLSLSLSLSSYLSSNVASFTFLLFFTGEHGKLGHGNNTTQKVPKLISGLNDKVIKQVSCGNRHSAAVTSDNQLYTWGEGEYGRLGKYYKCIQELMIFNGSWCIHTTSL